VEMGRELARRFEGVKIDRILTAEISGIAPALTTGLALNVPVVHARNTTPITMAGPVLLQTAPSPANGGEPSPLMPPAFLHAGENVLIIDDFLASGQTLMALARMVKSAKANLVGVGAVVEKEFEGGRALMHKSGYTHIPIEALVIITSMEDGKIVLAD